MTRMEQDTIEYRTKRGDIVTFNIPELKKFGFYYLSRVNTPIGPATVIGVRQGTVWFHVDGDPGASYWDTCRSMEDFKEMGFHEVQQEPLLW